MKDAVNATGIGTLVLLAAFALLSVLGISLIRSLGYIFSVQANRKQRAIEMARVSVKRIVVTFITLAVVGYSWNYWREARLRAHCEPKERNSERSPDGNYLARYCYFENTIVLRLYDTEGQHLIAERTYRDTSGVPVELSWRKDVLMYPDGPELGEIRLPPPLLDRVMSRLP